MTLTQLRAPSHFGLGICARRIGHLRQQAEPPGSPATPHCVRIALRPYQIPVFMDRTSGILLLHWSRQIGKSFTLAAWAVDRLLTRPGRLVTVLSNSRENGAEFLAKCAEVCHLNGTLFESHDLSRGLKFQNMRMEIRIRAEGQTGRIKVLAANPRTARGFSGDLILDEFAFHEDSAAIWEAAEPILASNPDYLCRIASTGNGRHNLFYRLASGSTANLVGTSRCDVRPPSSLPLDLPPASRAATIPLTSGVAPASRGSCLTSRQTLTTDASPSPRGEGRGEGQPVPNPKFPSLHPSNTPLSLSNTPLPSPSHAGYPVSRVTRSDAFQMGVSIYDPLTREPITPDHARAQALDKRAYDQNYECSFADENLTLLSHSLISAAESDTTGYICEQTWSNVLVAPTEVGTSRCDVRPSSSVPVSDRPCQSMPGSFDPSITPSPELSTMADDASPSPRGEGQPHSATWPTARSNPQWAKGRGEGSSSNPQSAIRNPQFPLDFLRSLHGPLFAGLDVGRKIDLSVLTVLEQLDDLLIVRAILRMRDLRLPDQQLRLAQICRLPRFRRAAIDMTGLGLGLCEYAQQQFGATRIIGINFATTVPLTKSIALEGRRRETVRVTEALATELLQAYEDRRLRHPCDAQLRDDLRKPEKITTPGGRVSIAACRDEAGHADHFWSLALALEAAAHAPAPFAYKTIQPHRPRFLL